MTDAKDELPPDPDKPPPELPGGGDGAEQLPGGGPPDGAGPPGQQPDPPVAAEGWTLYADTTYFEMRPIAPGEDLTGVATSAQSATIMGAFVGHPPGGMITRHPGDLNRSQWWFTPQAIVEQRYKAS